MDFHRKVSYRNFFLRSHVMTRAMCKSSIFDPRPRNTAMVLSEEEMSLPSGGASTSSRIRCPAEVLLESDILSQEQIFGGSQRFNLDASYSSLEMNR